MTWTVKRVDVACGAQPGCRIPPGAPVAIVAGKYRCQIHAGAPVDEAQLEAALFALECEDAEVANRRRETNLARVQERPRLARQMSALTEVIKHADLPAEVRRRDQAIAGRDE